VKKKIQKNRCIQREFDYEINNQIFLKYKDKYNNLLKRIFLESIR